jgi:hypothetical protein
MQALVWWTVPLAAFVVAIVWVSIANRPRPPADPHDSVAEHERFRAAMDRQTGGAPAADRARDDVPGGPPQERPPGSTPAAP